MQCCKSIQLAKMCPTALRSIITRHILCGRQSLPSIVLRSAYTPSDYLSSQHDESQKIKIDKSSKAKTNSKERPVFDKKKQNDHDSHPSNTNDEIPVFKDIGKKHAQYKPAAYFEKVWLKHQSNVDSPQNQLENPIPMEEPCNQTKFGNSQLKDSQQSFASKKDFRDPNERMDEAFPEDVDEPRDRRLDIPLSREGRIGLRAFYYTRKMSVLARHGKIKEAIEIFDDWMMLRDRVMPCKRTFITLIGILGRAGYTKRAFELFSQMQNLGLDPVDHIYTGLFNACANSPSQSDGLRRAEDLLFYLQDRDIQPNLYTVKAAMKAVAICGDFPKAFLIMDDAAKRLRLDTECFNHLLIACVSDKEKGFLRALQVWGKMSEYRLKPDIHTINLFTRCVRDCGIGDPATFAKSLGLGETPLGISSDAELLKSLPSSSSSPLRLQRKTKLLKDGKRSPDVMKSKDKDVDSKQQIKHDDLKSNDLMTETLVQRDQIVELNDSQTNAATSVNQENKPQSSTLNSDLLPVETLPSQPQTVPLALLKTPSGRLALLGGMKRIFSLLKDLSIEPEVKTFSQILACLPQDHKSELEMLEYMKERGVKPDIDLMNDIMNRCCKRGEFSTVKEVLSLVGSLKLIPNMRTYAALALACTKAEQAMSLLDDMAAANLEPNSEIIGHLVTASGGSFTYKLKMLKLFDSYGLKPTGKTIEKIEKNIAAAKAKIIEAERNKDTSSYVLSEDYQRSLTYFLRFYKVWLQRTEIKKVQDPRENYKPFIPKKKVPDTIEI